jgi:uncharacterized protein with PIN domain
MDYHAVMKEWYWLVIYAALIAVAFAPTFLKARCPQCKKRKLETVDLDQRTREDIEHKEEVQYLTFFQCTACGARFLREKTAPYKDASDPRWNLAYDRAFTTIVS